MKVERDLLKKFQDGLASGAAQKIYLKWWVKFEKFREDKKLRGYTANQVEMFLASIQDDYKGSTMWTIMTGIGFFIEEKGVNVKKFFF